MDFGKLEYTMNECFVGSGKSPVRLMLTLIGQGDEKLLNEAGLAELRRRRILRLTQEAFEQGCPLGYDDLSVLLLTSLATLKRDIVCLKSSGVLLHLRDRRGNGNASVEGKMIA